MANVTDRTPVVLERPSTYLALLNEQLEIRAREHGKAWITPKEDAWVRAHNLKPRYTYTVMNGNWTETRTLHNRVR